MSLAPIEQGKPLDAPLSEPHKPSETWRSLAHSDSTASIDAEQAVTDRVDSVALAHMRLDKLHKANDSVALAKKRQGSSGDISTSGKGGDVSAPASSAADIDRENSGSKTAASGGLLNKLATKLHLKKDSPTGRDTSSRLQRPSGSSPRVRFSESEDRPMPDDTSG